MAAVVVRNLNDDVLRKIKIRAKSEGLSQEGYLRQIIEQNVATGIDYSMDAIVERAYQRVKNKPFVDVVELIHEGREERLLD